jgi:hypothetical protein
MKTRENIPIDEDDLNLINAIRTPGTPEHQAAEELLGVDPDRDSKATILARVLHEGVQTVRERALAVGYVAYAAAYDEEDRAFDDAMRRRGRSRTDEE